MEMHVQGMIYGYAWQLPQQFFVDITFYFFSLKMLNILMDNLNIGSIYQLQIISLAAPIMSSHSVSQMSLLDNCQLGRCVYKQFVSGFAGDFRPLLGYLSSFSGALQLYYKIFRSSIIYYKGISHTTKTLDGYQDRVINLSYKQKSIQQMFAQ